MLIFLTILAVWFGVGFAMAPRAAAYGYRNSPYNYESMKRGSASCYFWWSRAAGPLVLLVMAVAWSFTRLSAGTRRGVDKALSRHDAEYRRRHGL